MTATTGSLHDLRATATGRASRGTAGSVGTAVTAGTVRGASRPNTVRRSPRGTSRAGAGAGATVASTAVIPQRTAPGRAKPLHPAAPLPAQRKQKTRRLGSQQQVSIRGRRIIAKEGDRRLTRLVVIGIAALVVGITCVMYFSGLSTQ